MREAEWVSLHWIHRKKDQLQEVNLVTCLCLLHQDPQHHYVCANLIAVLMKGVLTD